MGYYSDVAFTIYKKDAYDLLKRAEKECPKAYELLCNDVYVYDHCDAISFVKEYIKWRDGGIGINYIKNYIENLDDCSFREIGEDFVVDYWDNGESDICECIGIEFDFNILDEVDSLTTCAWFLESYKPDPVKEPPLDTNMLLNKINAAEALIEEIKIIAEDFSDVPEGRDVKSQCIMVDGGLGFLKRCIGYLEEALSEEYPEE